MRRLTFIALLLMLAAVLSARLSAVGKITVDPNAPGSSATAEEAIHPFEADSRLGAKVTYKARKKTVSAILADISRTTGVVLRSGYNSADWQVRDRKMNIYAKEVPLRDLMQSIARVMKFKWIVGGDEETPTYRLFMDRRTLLEAEGQMYRAEERLELQKVEKRTELVGTLSDLASLSEEDVGKLREESPYLYALAQTELAGPLSALLSDTPAARDAFIRNQELKIGAGELPPAAQTALLRTVERLKQLDGSDVSGDREIDPDRLTMSINPASSSYHLETTKPFVSRFVLGTMSFGYATRGDDGTRDHDPLEIVVPQPDSFVGRLMGMTMLRTFEDPDEVGKQGGRSVPAGAEEMRGNDYGEPAVEHPDDPALDIEVVFKSEKNAGKDAEIKTFDDFLLGLGESSGFSVVSDALLSESFRTDFGNAKMPLRKLLDNVAMVWNHNWWRRGEVLEFRDRYWFRKRALQIPEAHLEKWRDTMRQTGTLDLDSIAEIARLLPDKEHCKANVQGDEVLDSSDLLQTLQWNRAFFRFYCSLDQSSRSAIFSESGLDFDALAPQQRELADQYCPCPRTGEGDAAGSLCLCGTKKQKGKQLVYSFSVWKSSEQFPEALKVRQESLTTPEYGVQEYKESGTVINATVTGGARVLTNVIGGE